MSLQALAQHATVRANDVPNDDASPTHPLLGRDLVSCIDELIVIYPPVWEQQGDDGLGACTTPPL